MQKKQAAVGFQSIGKVLEASLGLDHQSDAYTGCAASRCSRASCTSVMASLPR